MYSQLDADAWLLSLVIKSEVKLAVLFQLRNLNLEEQVHVDGVVHDWNVAHPVVLRILVSSPLNQVLFHQVDEVVGHAFFKAEEVKSAVVWTLFEDVFDDNSAFFLEFFVKPVEFAKHLEKTLRLNEFSCEKTAKYADHKRHSMTEVAVELQDDHGDGDRPRYAAGHSRSSKD